MNSSLVYIGIINGDRVGVIAENISIANRKLKLSSRGGLYSLEYGLGIPLANNNKNINYGYVCNINGDKSFVVAENIAEAMDIMEEISKNPNDDYSFETHSSIPILNIN